MNQKQVMDVLGEVSFYPDGTINIPELNVIWFKGQETAILDDMFTADELEAIVWIMKNKEGL